ncbi:MAG: DUF1499 domain-containing protein [Thermoanaerobaculia bacterium]|nr:DUF1499 domain-containing protein [Thermoanaerobaculia bacterium]
MRTALLVAVALVLVASLALIVRFVTLAKISQDRAGRSLSPDLGASPLAACPNQPGCARREVAGSELDGALESLRANLERAPRTRIVRVSPTYLRAEVRSRLFGFVDDVEARLDPVSGQLELRSASRVGKSDLGVNGARLDRLLKALLGAGT